MVRTRSRWTAVITLVACAVLLVVAGCSATGSADSSLVVRDSANGHTVSLTVGMRLEVILASDYWTVQGSSRPHVLRQDGPTSQLPKPPSCGAIPGMGCVPIRTDFSAVAPGTVVITASRASCGEAMRCMPDQQHFILTVVVRGKT